MIGTQVKIGLHPRVQRIVDELAFVITPFAEQKEYREGGSGEEGAQQSGDRCWERIELRSAEGNQFVTAGKAHFGELQCVQFREGPHVCAVGLPLRGMATECQEHAIMEGSEIRYADEEVAADFQNPADFVPDPENFFGVLKDLIGDHQAGAAIGQRKCIALEIEGKDDVESGAQRVDIGASALLVDMGVVDSNGFGSRMNLLNGSEIATPGGSKIHCGMRGWNQPHQLINDTGPVSFLFIREPGPDTLLTARTGHYACFLHCIIRVFPLTDRSMPIKPATVYEAAWDSRGLPVLSM